MTPGRQKLVPSLISPRPTVLYVFKVHCIKCRLLHILIIFNYEYICTILKLELEVNSLIWFPGRVAVVRLQISRILKRFSFSASDG